MPHSIPESKRNRISTKIDLGIPLKDIAKEEHITVRLVQQIKSNLRRYGSPKRPKGPRQGRPTKITAEMQEVWTLLFFFSPENR
jgi:transposase